MDPEFARQYYESAAVDHWWFEGRRQLVAQLSKRWGVKEGRFVDLGAGAESLFPDMLEVVKLDIVRPEFVPDMFVQASAEDLPFANGAFDGLGLFDVLEHLVNPEKCLSEVRRVVRLDGLVYVTVPAYQWLWSPHDRLVGHVRRYSPEELRESLASAGLRVVWSSAFYGFLMMPAVVRAALSLGSSMKRPSDAMNAVLTRAATRSVQRALRRPTNAGLSLAALAVVDASGDG